MVNILSLFFLKWLQIKTLVQMKAGDMHLIHRSLLLYCLTFQRFQSHLNFLAKAQFYMDRVTWSEYINLCCRLVFGPNIMTKQTDLGPHHMNYTWSRQPITHIYAHPVTSNRKQNQAVSQKDNLKMSTEAWKSYS